MFDMIYPKQDEGMVTIVYKEGSVFWALEKMIEGKTVVRKSLCYRISRGKTLQYMRRQSLSMASRRVIGLKVLTLMTKTTIRLLEPTIKESCLTQSSEGQP